MAAVTSCVIQWEKETSVAWNDGRENAKVLYLKSKSVRSVVTQCLSEVYHVLDWTAKVQEWPASCCPMLCRYWATDCKDYLDTVGVGLTGPSQICCSVSALRGFLTLGRTGFLLKTALDNCVFAAPAEVVTSMNSKRQIGWLFSSNMVDLAPSSNAENKKERIYVLKFFNPLTYVKAHMMPPSPSLLRTLKGDILHQ